MREDWLAKSPEERAAISRQRNVDDLKGDLRRQELIQRGKYSEQEKAIAREKATSIKEKLTEKGASKAEIQDVVDKVHKPYSGSISPRITSGTGAKVEVRKSRSIKRQELEEGPHHVMATDTEGNPVGVEAQRSTTAEDAINEHFDSKKYAPEMRPMMERLKDAVMRIAGDTPVHYIGHDAMLSLGERARGVYDPGADHILLNADKMTHDTALHEAFHAATTKALAADPELKSLMSRLQAEMGDKSDPEEFLTRLMTDNKLQDQFKSAKISPELARDIGIPKWRKATMWEGALNLMRRALGLGPRDVSAVEAAMAVSEKAMWKRDPGMAMEAGARSLGLRFQKEEREAPPERDQEAFLKTPSEHLAGIKNIDKDMVKDYAKDMASNTKVLLTKTAKFLSGTQLRICTASCLMTLRVIFSMRSTTPATRWCPLSMTYARATKTLCIAGIFSTVSMRARWGTTQSF